jgi:diguanylate cyclase (GGDEF)-like protein
MLPADPEGAALEDSSLMRILLINHRSEESQRFRQMLEAATDVRFGAQDCLVKTDCDTRLLVRTLRHARERHRILTDLARSRQHEHYLATHDSLTTLPNRLALMDHLLRTLAYAARTQSQLAVLFLDLDRFKNINDSLGHGIGDELLRIVSQRLVRLLRKSDMVARLGGDEFIIMLRGIKRDLDAARAARKITEAMMRPFLLNGKEYRITASIGIAIYPEDGTTIDVLMRNADTAMYHAKDAGPNRFSHYSKRMNEIVSERLDLENGLAVAIERNSFEIHYQPVIDIGLGIVVGAEALLRWRHPERGIIPPSEFIHHAEEGGLITAIGEWVLRTACQDAASWPQLDGRPLHLSVNISTRQLCEHTFPDAVMRTLRETGLEPSRLELEITEHSVLQESAITMAALELVRDLGARVVIDDFGTGYSALSALKLFPVDGLKIDRSFVCDILSDPADATIIRGILTIARGLELVTTAEGVETREQMELLYSLGCHRMQGYLFAKPMPADEFAERIAAGETAWTEPLPDPG